MRQYTHREFVKIVKANGFQYDRHNGDHAIYLNDNGMHISVPAKLESVIARRLIKENNLELNLKKLKKMNNLSAGTAMDNYNYPIGSDTPNAPWNEELNEEVEVLISITYSKSTSVSVPKGVSEAELKKYVEDIVFKPHEALSGTWTIDDFEVIKE